MGGGVISPSGIAAQTRKYVQQYVRVLKIPSGGRDRGRIFGRLERGHVKVGVLGGMSPTNSFVPHFFNSIADATFNVDRFRLWHQKWCAVMT